MELGDISFACASSLVAGLVDGGVSHAALSPGSRSTPLALALARDPRVQVHVQLDERSGGFLALGAAKATGRPVVVACTSGTAAAELLPVVVEASQARVPLVVLTADRPPRLRGTGANQTIVQPRLYGEYVRTSLDLPVPSTAGQEAWWRQAAREALEAMATDPTGPVHLNCPFEEPLTPTTDTLPIGGDAVEEPFAWPLAPRPSSIPTKRTDWPNSSPALGAPWYSGMARAPLRRGPVLGRAPGLARPRRADVGARQPETSLAAGQAVIAGPWAETHGPDVVIQFGASPRAGRHSGSWLRPSTWWWRIGGTSIPIRTVSRPGGSRSTPRHSRTLSRGIP